MECGEATLVKDCMICHREVILIAKRTVKRLSLPEKDSILPQVCGECREKYLKEGVLMINPNNGKLIVIRDTAFGKIFKGQARDDGLKRRIVFTDDEVLDLIQSRVRK